MTPTRRFLSLNQHAAAQVSGKWFDHSWIFDLNPFTYVNMFYLLWPRKNIHRKRVYWKCNVYMNRSVRLSVGRSVRSASWSICHNFKKGGQGLFHAPIGALVKMFPDPSRGRWRKVLSHPVPCWSHLPKWSGTNAALLTRIRFIRGGYRSGALRFCPVFFSLCPPCHTSYHTNVCRSKKMLAPHPPPLSKLSHLYFELNNRKFAIEKLVLSSKSQAPYLLIQMGR